MNQLEELNHSAYQYYTSNLPTVLEICQPLFEIGVKFFGYIKIFEDGSYFHTATNEEMVNHFFLTIKSQGATPTQKIETTPKGQPYHVMMPSNLSLFDPQEELLLYFAYDHNIWPAYVIYKNKGAYIEAYTFAMSRSDEQASEFYLKKAPLLEHFCLYFSERAVSLINADDRKKRGYFQQQFNFNKVSQEDQELQKAEQFLLKTQLQRLTLRGQNQEVLLSKRETECLRDLALGKSVKAIAHELSLSSRTVEFYLSNIKNKTGYAHRTQMITAYLQSEPTIKLGEKGRRKMAMRKDS